MLRIFSKQLNRSIPAIQRAQLTPRFYSAQPPSVYGPGAESGTVPTDESQATGIERMELLTKAQGAEMFDMSPLVVDRMGTMKDPIIVPSLTPIRIVGSTGCK